MAQGTPFRIVVAASVHAEQTGVAARSCIFRSRIFGTPSWWNRHFYSTVHCNNVVITQLSSASHLCRRKRNPVSVTTGRTWSSWWPRHTRTHGLMADVERPACQRISSSQQWPRWDCRRRYLAEYRASKPEICKSRFMRTFMRDVGGYSLDRGGVASVRRRRAHLQQTL